MLQNTPRSWAASGWYSDATTTGIGARLPARIFFRYARCGPPESNSGAMFLASVSGTKPICIPFDSRISMAFALNRFAGSRAR
jgi:hypothetical protein